MTAAAPKPNLDDREVEKFAKIAAEWWDPFGKFKPLHKFNPVRLGFIRDEACAHFGRERTARRPLEGLSLIDIGCGGGLVCEPMRRLGAEVTGLDASERNIGVASAHARAQDLDIAYRASTVEALHEAGEQYDIVLTLEVVEHVPDVDSFLAACAGLVKPGGLLVMATINRTLKAFALAKIGAEYVLRWTPVGSHDPRKFVKPEEARAALEAAGLAVAGPVGVSYAPLLDAWRISDDAAINYMLSAKKPA